MGALFSPPKAPKTPKPPTPDEIFQQEAKKTQAATQAVRDRIAEQRGNPTGRRSLTNPGLYIPGD